MLLRLLGAVANTRMWAETTKELIMNAEYEEYPAVTQSPIIDAAMPDIFAREAPEVISKGGA